MELQRFSASDILWRWLPQQSCLGSFLRPFWSPQARSTIPTVRWKNLFLSNSFQSLALRKCFRRTASHMAIIIYLANLLNVCPLYTLMTLATPKFVEKVKTGEPRDFYLGHLGLLLNIRRVDKRKSETETKLDPVTFAATEGQLGEKVRWMKEEATRVDPGLYIYNH